MCKDDLQWLNENDELAIMRWQSQCPKSAVYGQIKYRMFDINITKKIII